MNADLEEIILGQVVYEQGAIDRVMPILEPEDFVYHKDIFSTMCDMKNRDEAIDLLTVGLKHKEVIPMASRIGLTSHLEHHAMILKEQSLRRQMKDCDDKDIFEELNRIMQEATLVSQRIRKPMSIAEAVRISIKEMEQQGDTSGLNTGFNILDRQIHNLRPGEVIVIAGGPGMGKSALALNIVNYLSVDSNIPTVYFSLEMKTIDQAKRLSAIRTQISLNDIISGELSEHNWKEIHEANERISSSPLVINDVGELTVSQLKSQAHLYVQEGIKLIVIDHLSLMTGIVEKGKSKSRENIVSEISRGIKQIAMTLEIPIIAVAHINRQNLKRSDKRPMLGDLRESGAIEQDADVVLFPYRPEYYNFDTIEMDGITQGTKNFCELIVAKNRNGKTGGIQMTFVDETVTFKDGYSEIFG